MKKEVVFASESDEESDEDEEDEEEEELLEDIQREGRVPSWRRDA